MSTLMQASNQWASRPADERFVSLIELAQHTRHVRDLSAARVVSSRSIQLAPADDNKGLMIQGPNGGQAGISHFAFGQLAQLAGAPAGYLRSLPSPMAADCVNFGLQVKRDVDEVGVLLSRANGQPAMLRAATGPNYGRIWNSDIADALVNRFGDGLTGQFKVPGEFGQRVEITKANTTLYAGDRDMFVFLADEDHKIEMPNRRDGRGGLLSRGFFVWNSEVGSSTFGVATFLFDYVCCNRIVWGAEGYKEITIRHTAGAPDRFVEQVAPALESYANSSTASITKAIEDARAARIGDGAAVSEFLAKRFTKSQVSAIQQAHIADEGRPIETLWDATTGITAYARSIPFQDDRVKLEREAGKVMDAARR